jgi:pyruvate/2-oxoglutarate dehydrogenase complex dihydrolipoamide acyltransferase (E2) component
MLFFQFMKCNACGLHEKQGNVMLTLVGMFGRGGGGGWGIIFLPLHMIGVMIGGIQMKPAIVNGEIIPQELLSFIIAFDHDIIDGAPAA